MISYKYHACRSQSNQINCCCYAKSGDQGLHCHTSRHSKSHVLIIENIAWIGGRSVLQANYYVFPAGSDKKVFQSRETI